MTQQKWCDEINGLLGRHPDFHEMKDLFPIIIGYIGHRYKLVLLYPENSQDLFVLRMDFPSIGRQIEYPGGWSVKVLPMPLIQKVVAAAGDTNPTILSMSGDIPRQMYSHFRCMTTTSRSLVRLEKYVFPPKNLLKIINTKTGVEKSWRLLDFQTEHLLPLSRFDLILFISKCENGKVHNSFHVFAPSTGSFVDTRVEFPILPQPGYRIIRAQIVNDPETDDQFLIALFAHRLGTPSLLISRIQILPPRPMSSTPMTVCIDSWFNPFPTSTSFTIPVIRAVPEIYLS